MANFRQLAVVNFYLRILWCALASGSLLEAESNPFELNSSAKFSAISESDSSACTNCGKKQPSTYATTDSTFRRHPLGDSNVNKVLPEESEKIVFSRKYSPEAMTDGFVPIPGPYSAKSSRSARARSFKPVGSQQQIMRPSAPRNINAVKHEQNKRHGRRGGELKSQRDAQRRVQHRPPSPTEDLSAKESIMSGNILGNGNFEIIRGGVFSDEERNEILGSRRMARGFRSFGMPMFHGQNGFNPIQTVQFPPVYTGRFPQNQFSPLFYPRGGY